MSTLMVFSFMILIAGTCEAKNDTAVKNNGRQKRLLFYDEEGNLVKTYKNPYLYSFPQKLESQLATNSLNPFFSLLRPAIFGTYIIPVSDEVIHQYSNDPLYENKLLTLPRKDLVMETNPLCSGLRTQLPSKDCEKFWNCWDGWAFEQECPDGLVFSRDGFCDYPQNVDCSKRFMEPSGPTSSQQLPGHSPQPSQPVIQPSQPTYQLPQQETKPAVQPTKPLQPIEPAKLPSFPSISQSIAPLQQLQPAIQSPCNKDYQAFRNEQGCNEFFVCVNNVPIKFKCPADLFYNENIGVCDYPYRVECKVAPDDSKSKPGTPCASLASEEYPGVATSSSGNNNSVAPLASLVPPVSDVRTNVESLSNSVLFSQNWTSAHVAISRQDAVRQLKLGAVANLTS